MTFLVELAGPAARYLVRLDVPTQGRFAVAIRALADDPFGPGTKALHGRPERSLRIGGWRLLYTVDRAARTVMVTSIAPRGQAYRGR